MRSAGAHYRAGGRFIQALVGWTLATTIVLAAVFGPPLTAQSIPTMVEIRHDVLMIDREFERWTLPANRSFDEHAYKLAEASRDR
jgi:hypothetical protein